LIGNETFSFGEAKRSRYRAAGTTKPAIEYINGVLQTDAYVFDTIHRVSATIESDSRPYVGEEEEQKAQDRFKSGPPEIYDDKKVFQSLYRLFTYRDDSATDDPAESEYLAELWGKNNTKLLQEHFPQVGMWLLQHESFPIHSGIGMKKFLTSMSWRHADRKRGVLMGKIKKLSLGMEARIDKDYGSSVLRRQLLANIWKPLSDRLRLMFGTTYIGWVSSNARPGDKLCILKGCSVVAILRRRSEGGFTVVGDAFVDGVMSGEMVRSNKLEPSNWEKVKIY